YAFPPPDSGSAILQRSGVKVLAAADSTSGSALSPAKFNAPDKTPVVGTVKLPDGSTAAPNVQVVAEPIATVSSNPLPLQHTTAPGAELGSSGPQVPNASVRFFRVAQSVDQKPVPGLLLGETTTDDKGNYAIVLPAK